MEKPKAITTNSARIFLLDIFLIALVKAPKRPTAKNTPYYWKKRDGEQSFLASLHPDCG
jgi:hypothetical protein